MGFLDAILGRSRPAKPNLDVLFAVPAASLTLQAGLGLAPTGTGAVCVTSAEGQTVAENDVLALLSVGTSGRTTSSRDEYGYTWITVHRPDADLSALVTDLHAANTTLVDAGYGTGLLCTVIGFAGTVADQPRRVGLVYLFKRGTFYPFAPIGDQQRDTTLELRIREQLGEELPVEADLGRWFPIWNSPGIQVGPTAGG